MHKLLSILSLIAIAANAAAQIAGGSAAFSSRAVSGVLAARANELAKRNFPFEDGRFLDASVLMNVAPDEYVAVFGISQEGSTLDDAQQRMDARVKSFSESLGQLNIAASDYFVDFIAQNRIYGYDVSQANVAIEQLVGFEVKKNVSIRFRDKSMLDKLIASASKSGIFDLVKVDYVIADIAPIRKRLMEAASSVIKAKAEEQELLLGVKVGQLTHVLPVRVSLYFPVDMYDAYVAEESENVAGYRQGMTIQRARKPRTFYYNALSAQDFDHVINPVVIEPAVQATIYVRVKY